MDQETTAQTIDRISKQGESWKAYYYDLAEQAKRMRSALEFALKYNAMRAEQGKREFPSQLVNAINKAIGK